MSDSIKVVASNSTFYGDHTTISSRLFDSTRRLTTTSPQSSVVAKERNDLLKLNKRYNALLEQFRQTEKKLQTCMADLRRQVL